MSRILIWPVSGMHCASCERLISAELKKLPGVEEVEVDLKKSKAGVQLRDDAPEPDLEKLNAALHVHGYHLGERAKKGVACEVPATKRPFGQRLTRALAAVIVMGLALKIIYVPLSHLVPSVSADASYLALFAFGMVASVSTCLASTGAFLLAYTAEGKSKAKALAIHAGRLASFAAGGALLGAIGGTIPATSSVYGILALTFGIGFALVGLHLLNLTPSLAKLGIRLPKQVGGLADKIVARRGATTPFLVGAVTFLLPCGFTQTAQALALASGSPSRGALMMLAFALGTLPVLLGLTVFGSMAAFKHPAIKLATGALLLFFSVGQIDGGLTVVGSPLTIGGAVSSLAAGFSSGVAVAPANAQEQVISMNVQYGAFSPNRFTLKRNVPVRWEINGIDISGCASSIIAPTLGISRFLNPGINVIQFTPKQRGTIPFSCGMGMIRGSFNVVD